MPDDTRQPAKTPQDRYVWAKFGQGCGTPAAAPAAPAAAEDPQSLRYQLSAAKREVDWADWFMAQIRSTLRGPGEPADRIARALRSLDDKLRAFDRREAAAAARRAESKAEGGKSGGGPRVVRRLGRAWRSR